MVLLFSIFGEKFLKKAVSIYPLQLINALKARKNTNKIKEQNKRWLAKDEDDGSVVRELIPNKVIEESVTEDGEVETKEVDQETLERK